MTRREDDVHHRALHQGTRFAERYRILATLGAGGMGAVYRAYDELVGETVALKVSSAMTSTDGRTRVSDEQRREVAMARRVTHPNVARVYDLGVVESSIFLTMELVEGRTLSALRTERRLALSEIATLGRQVASALAAAHGVGVLHLDLKPQNVMIAEGRTLRAVLVDFGIAQALGSAGSGLGTPDYVSPEQLARDPLTGASDIFSLGVVLYELLARRRAFDGPTPGDRAMARLHSSPPALDAPVPPAFAELVAAMLAPTPSERPTALEAERGLCALLDRVGPLVVDPVDAPPPADTDATHALRDRAHPSRIGRATSSASADPATLPDSLGLALAVAYASLAVVGQEADAAAVAARALEVDGTLDVALSLRALALARHWNLTHLDQAEDIAERAAEAVAEALRQAGHLADTHLADALVGDYSGDVAYAVRALRRALALDPLHAFSHEVLGRIEIEGGRGGVERLRMAFARDTSRHSTHALIARELYFEGDRAGAEHILTELERLRPAMNETRTLRCRIALWERDRATAERLLATLPHEGPPILDALRAMLEALTGAGTLERAIECMSLLQTVRTTPKRHAFHCQLWAELLGTFERPEGLRYVVHAAQLPLSDLRWLEACPSLDRYRAEPAFKYARALVEDRIDEAFRSS